MSEVVVVNADYSCLHIAFSRIFSHIGTDLLSHARQVAIKINLCDYKPPETGATTHPKFLDAFLEWLGLLRGDLNVYVVESDATQARPDLISRWLGFDEVMRKHGAKWANLSKDTSSRRNIRGATTARSCGRYREAQLA
jgi:uncharacterized protein (DUF362 family)